MAFTKDIVTDEQVKAYLGIDYGDDMITSNITLMKEAAADFLNSSVGELENGDDSARAKMLALAVIADMYDNRSYNDYSTKASVAVRKLVSDFSLQLILEGRAEE